MNSASLASHDTRVHRISCSPRTHAERRAGPLTAVTVELEHVKGVLRDALRDVSVETPQEHWNAPKRQEFFSLLQSGA